MKLSENQLEQIKAVAQDNSIFYQDIRNELIDHLASKVEELMGSGLNFEEAFLLSKKEVNPNEFQRKILMASHLGYFKSIFKNLLNWRILLKSIPLFTFMVLIFFIRNLDPFAAEKGLKVIVISCTVAMALMGLWGGLLKNSQVVSAGNTLWLTICISQLLLDLDTFVWIGISPHASIYLITFSLCLLLISGLSEVVTQTKRSKLI
ncbi:hypothetical protein [Algoriphagus sediminis]|uniref:DUF1700 domain-containing protein n=1 Tax=Algoriphagus sediminis TaxID=3057113 RepID=A0ABT7YGY0_9BACT|nr:hypothetical protein [Algoriphagus sediminis]MDN3205790.1 hypothetical protein [Algoriphagus sediminis]